MIRNILTLMVCTGLAVLAACSSSEDEDKFASSDVFCASRADAECTNLAASCGATVEACKQKRVTACNSEASAAASKGRSYHSAAAQPCIEATNAVYAPKVVDPAQEKILADVCARVFTGAKKKNEACANVDPKTD